MPTILVPERMPPDLQTRATTSAAPIQAAQPVRGSAMGRVEAALAHLVAARPLGCPASAHRMELSTTGDTVYLRIAAPIAPLYALVAMLFTADSEDVVDVSITTTTQPTPATLQFSVGLSGQDTPTYRDLPVEIGTGAIEAANVNHETIAVTVNKNDAGTTVYLESIIVAPLPIYEPYAPPEVTST